MRLSVPVAAALTAAGLGCQGARAAEPTPYARLAKPAAASAGVEERALRETIARLVGFGTRHTLSDTRSQTRGIGAARRWTKDRFESFSRACSGCLEVVTPGETVTGARVPSPTLVEDVIAIQRGTSDPDRVVVISGHIDSRVTDVMNAVSDAPGANDDGSGTAAVIEAARVLSKHRFPATLVFAVLSGEEQGLLGGKVLANYAKSRGWRVEAVLNNDIVGNTRGQGGEVVRDQVRVFSEGTKAVETPEQAKARRYNGGEVDAPSRNLARFVAGVAERYTPGFKVRMVYRTDRFSRGGDQVAMLEGGYPSVRLSEGAENYDRQHQDLRTENGRRYGDVIEGVDFPYLTQVTRLNVAVMAALASAPPPPEGVAIKGAVTADTTVSWSPALGAVGYRVWWRETTSPRWEHSRWAGQAASLVLPGVNIDNWFFGASAVAADGSESPVVFPGPPGSFLSRADAK